ncbi:HEAT repeat domain-containing protein [Marinitoga lauensis]|uniref:HEAT repeat domain-containing protein n=1 Tax=Marinitoga lauensis TaxID=2201189 RepID=UPI0010106431|nr:HEAT repeat domain-containing protein [Marinitoga lauensis]
MQKSENKDFRKYALDGLYRTGLKEAKHYIAKGLEDTDINNQIAAIEYLGLLEANEYAEKIAEKLTNAENSFLISTVIETLAIIGNDNTDKIIKEKLKNHFNPYLYLPYARYIFKRENIYECINFFKQSEKKELILKEFLECLTRYIPNVRSQNKLKKEVVNILCGLMKKDILNEYKYNILIILNDLLDREISDILKENIDYLNNEGLIAAIEIIKQKNLESLKNEILKK